MPTPRFEITDHVTHHSGATGQVADILEPDREHPGFRYRVVRGPGDRGVTWPERALSEGEAHTPNRALNRAQLETIAWQVTPADYRGGSGSRRSILVSGPQGTTTQPLSDMTDNQIRKYIGPRALEEAGDMRKNGSPEESFIEDLRSRLDIGDRFVNLRVPYPGSVFLQFYNVPTTHQTRSHGADQENNRIMLTFSGLNGPKAKVEATVLGPSFSGPDWRLRAKSGTPEKVAEYAAAFLNRAAQKKPYGFTFDNYEKNAILARDRNRTEADEVAARELSLFIENDYALVGAPNSKGKAIERNLLSKIQRGMFDLQLSEKAWMYLMEDGAKKYCQEFGGTWSVVFNKATRELVAHEFATTFYEEHKATGGGLSQNGQVAGTKTYHLRVMRTGRVLASYVGASKQAAEARCLRSTGYETVYDAACALGMPEDDSAELVLYLSPNASDFEIEEFDAPAHWASAFINGDTSGLEEDELADFEAWNAKHPELGNVVDASEDTHFGRFNGLQTELCTYTAHVRK